MSETWIVNLPFSAVDEMRQKIAKLQAENTALIAENAKLKLGTDTGGIAAVLVDGMRAALPVIQFCQGNYDPETVRGWPHAALRKVAAVTLQMPGVTEIESEWANDVTSFADMAAAVERARMLGRQHELAKIPRAAIGDPAGYAGSVDKLMAMPPSPPELQAAQEQKAGDTDQGEHKPDPQPQEAA